MYALVANGIQIICKSQKQLNALIAIYPYPKFRVCHTMEEGRRWIRSNQRSYNNPEIRNYGDTVETGYVTVSYQIQEASVRYEIDTSLAGYIKVKPDEGVLVDGRQKKVVVICTGMSLDNNLIAHHVIAIRRILRILGEYVDVNICIPDISVYLAVTKYTGKDYNIRGVQKEISHRLGAVSMTIKNALEVCDV